MESLHLLAPADEVVLTPGVDLKVVTPEAGQNFISYLAPYDLSCVYAP